MKRTAKISPQAMAIFLKQAALEERWTTTYLSKALGLDLSTSHQVAAEMALAGYIESVPRKRDIWRNTVIGNTLAGVRSARLKRANAEDLLSDLEDRANQWNLKPKNDLQLKKVVVVGSITTEHDRIQDIDVAVQFRNSHQGQTVHEQELEALKFLKGGSPGLKLHGWDDSLGSMAAKLIWNS